VLCGTEFTAIPDITQLDWDPAHDEFIVIACDGVWDMYTSQEVVQMLRPAVVGTATTPAAPDLGAVLEEVLDRCLAPAAMGPGTDNFTILVVAPTAVWRERAKKAAAEKRSGM
jgi:protein phosphatase 2C family protein 2/3